MEVHRTERSHFFFVIMSIFLYRRILGGGRVLVLFDVHFRFLIVLEMEYSKWLGTRFIRNCVERS